MSKTISIHSFLRGIGRSTLAANVAASLAMEGRSIGLVDANLLTPSLHLRFGVEPTRSLDDYVLGKCPILEAAHEVTPRLGPGVRGRLLLVPASADDGQLLKVRRQGYTPELLGSAFRILAEELRLDALVVDADSGLDEQALTLMALSDVVAIVLHLDKQDYQGTAVMVDVARQLQAPRPALIVNPVSRAFDPDQVKTRVEQSYYCEVAGVLPYSGELMALGSEAIFVRAYPDHSLTRRLARLSQQLVQ